MRIVLAAGDRAEARRLLDLAVTTELGNLDGVLFRQHGPHIEGELLGAALLVGRGGELGERSKTALFRAFLGRDLPATWKRGETRELDALLAASPSSFDRALTKYLSSTWSTSSRSMKGSRASALGTGLGARVGAKLALKEDLERYVARGLLPAPREPMRPPLPTKLPRAPKIAVRLDAARDGSRPQETSYEQAFTLATWVNESIAHAKDEKSGMYLRAVPETACDVATLDRTPSPPPRRAEATRRR